MVAGNLVDTSSDYMAIFEITSKKRWTESLVPRLEWRLMVTLDRARAIYPSVTGILDAVAIIGVLGVVDRKESIAERVTSTDTPLLHQMMEPGRFVFVYKPYGGSPKPKSVGASSGHKAPGLEGAAGGGGSGTASGSGKA